MSKEPLTLKRWAKEVLQPTVDSLIAENKAKGIVWDEDLMEWVRVDGKDE